mgnify:CR=1 FL=1
MLLGLSDFRAPFSMPLEGASLMPTPHLFGYNILCQDTTLQTYGIMADRVQRIWALHMRLVNRALRDHARPRFGVVKSSTPPVLAPKRPVGYPKTVQRPYERRGVTNTLKAVWYVG